MFKNHFLNKEKNVLRFSKRGFDQKLNLKTRPLIQILEKQIYVNPQPSGCEATVLTTAPLLPYVRVVAI